MRILVVGATGTIGQAVVAALEGHHDIVTASLHKATVKVDISNPESIKAMYKQVGEVDAVISAAGPAKFAPMNDLTDADFAFTIANKLMGQVNLVRLGLASVREKGSFTLTSGVMARLPMVGGGVISLVNAGVEGFARAAALEAPRGIRVNVVSPPWVTETLKAYGMDTTHGLPSATVARAYLQSVTGSQNGAVIEPNAKT